MNGGKERFRRGKHVGQVRRLIGDFIDVEEHRAGDVGRLVGRPAGARVVRHEPGGVDDPQILVIEVGFQPFRGHHRVGHGGYSSQGGQGRPFSRRKSGFKILD